MDVQGVPLGTAHPSAVCCWCDGPLVVGEVDGLRCWACPREWQRQKAHALTLDTNGTLRCYNLPLPSQIELYESQARNNLWGGRAGPGKSHGVRWWLYGRSLSVPGHEALLLRENWDQLEKHHLRAMEREVRGLGGRFYKQERKVVFGKGSSESVIDCGHMADMDAVGRYLGLEYGAIVPDEASLYPVNTDGVPVIAELSTRARKEYRDRNGVVVAPRFVPVTNPGGPSAAWLRDMFIHHKPDYEMFPALRPVYDETGRQVKGYRPEQWRYIEALLSGNPYMREDYADTDLAVLSKVRYQQLAEGDWDCFSGQFFGEWAPSVHVAESVVM